MVKITKTEIPKSSQNFLREQFLGRKKVIFAFFFVILLLFFLRILPMKKTSNQGPLTRSVTFSVDKVFSFPAVNNQGKIVNSKVRLKVAKVEKTNQIFVNDKMLPARNNKMFLIVNLELKNDTTVPLNLVPANLVRLVWANDKENRFAPDLHNNTVLIAPLSTKLDRLGFVIPAEEKEFILYVGELEGKKEEIPLHFSS